MSIGFLIFEFIKVNFAFFFTMFVWPRTVFYKHLKGKSRTYTFAFCAVFMVVFINQITLLLGLLHILKVWLMRTLFWGIFVISLIKIFSGQKSIIRGVHNFVNSTMGIKSVILRIGLNIRDAWYGFITSIKEMTKGQLALYVILLLEAIYAVVYFCYGGFSYFSFGASDGNVHVSWIYQLAQGQIFASGIYPEGMHCLIYAMSELFPAELYSCMIFAPAGAVFLLVISIYIFLRELFVSKYTPLLAILGFLCIGTTHVLSMARLQWTLPQEYVFYSLFLCAAFLVRYCKYAAPSKVLPEVCRLVKNVFRKKNNQIPAPEKEVYTKWYWDENLLIYTLAIAATLCSHFYTTFLAVFMSVGLIPLLLYKLFRRKRFLPLLISSISGVLLALILMFAAYGEGYSLENSLYYGLGVMGVETSKNTSVREQSLDMQPELLPTLIYENELTANYGEEIALLVIVSSAIGVACFILHFAVSSLLVLIKKKSSKQLHLLDGYFALVLCTFCFFALSEGRSWGFWEILEPDRTYAIMHVLFMSVLVIPADIVLWLAQKVRGSWPVQAVTGILCVAELFCIIFTGHYHGYLYWNFSRYNGSVEVTESIVGKLPVGSFTLISTTDEIYQFVDYGWHEELIDFVNSSAMENQDSYTIPSEYVFLLVEKRPILRGQIHFLAGPSWLANDSYYELLRPSGMIGNQFAYMEAEDKFILEGNPNLETSLQNYADVVIRSQLMATSLVWVKRFEELYPNTLHTYYEDEEIACYYFKQNTDALYELAIR